MDLSRLWTGIQDGLERPKGASHPPQPRQLIAPSIRDYLPLRSPLSSGEGFFSVSVLLNNPSKTAIHKPSPLERGDRSGIETSSASFNDPVAVGEMHPLDALWLRRKCKKGLPAGSPCIFKQTSVHTRICGTGPPRRGGGQSLRSWRGRGVKREFRARAARTRYPA